MTDWLDANARPTQWRECPKCGHLRRALPDGYLDGTVCGRCEDSESTGPGGTP